MPGGPPDPDNPREAALIALVAALKIFVEKITPPPPSPKKDSWLPDWTNAPFVVTVLGGLLITGTTLLFQSYQAFNAQKAAKHAAEVEKAKQSFQQEYNSRKTVIMDFVNQFPAAAFRLYDYVYCDTWLVGHTTNAIHRSGRNYVEMWKRLEQLGDKRINSVMADSFPAQINTTFTNAAVLNLALTLQRQLNSLLEATNSKAADDFYSALNPSYDRLAKAMGLEIKTVQEREIHEDPK